MLQKTDEKIEITFENLFVKTIEYLTKRKKEKLFSKTSTNKF